MALLETTKVSDNEIVKASDWSYSFDSQITNITTALQAVLESTQDFVINGKVSKYGDGSSMAINIAPIFGICFSTGQEFINSDITSNISIPESSSYDDNYVVEVKGEFEEYDNQQRAFVDFETNVQTFQNVDTKKHLKLSVQIVKNDSQSAVAPNHTEGWVKIAEIFVPANATTINECTIKNITSDVSGEQNTSWTSEKTSTYNIGYISDVSRRFRVEHNSDGTHKADIIGSSELDTGTGTGKVNGTVIPTGDNASLNGTSYGASTSITELLKTVCTKITDLFNKYLINGAFNFNGEIAASSLVSANVLTNAIKIGASGDGTAYIKVGNNTVLTIQANGRLTTNGYTPTNTADLVTKSITDGIITTCNGLQTQINTINQTLADNTIYINSLLGRYKISVVAVAASTANVDVVSGGLITIDGVSVPDASIVLLKDQTNKKQNGIWIARSGQWDRGTYNTADACKRRIKIKGGNSNIGKTFVIPQDGYTFDGNYLASTNIEPVEIDQDISNVTGYCSSAADANTKIIYLTGYRDLIMPSEMSVTFEHGNKYGDTTTTPATYVSCQVYNSDNVLLGQRYICDSRGNYAGKGFCKDGDIIDFRNNDTKSRITNSDIRQADEGYIIKSDGSIEIVGYPQTETPTGRKWLDGKPTYVRSFSFARTYITDSLKNLVPNDFNCSKVVKGFIADDTNRESFGLRIRATNTYIQAYVDNHSCYANYLYIEYTKTTD